MTKEDIRLKEDKLANLYLAYYRLLVEMNDKFMTQENLKKELTDLAAEIEEDYQNLSKENTDGEKLC